MWKSVHSISSKSVESSQGQDLEVHFYLLKRLRKPHPPNIHITVKQFSNTIWWNTLDFLQLLENTIVTT